MDLRNLKYPICLGFKGEKGPTEIAAFGGSSGSRLITNAFAKASYSPATGKPLRRMETASSTSVVLEGADLANLVDLGKCPNPSCGYTHAAHSEMADVIEQEYASHKTKIFCVACGTPFSPSVDLDQLVTAMAADEADDLPDDSDIDPDNDGDDDTNAEGDTDGDMEDFDLGDSDQDSEDEDYDSEDDSTEEASSDQDSDDDMTEDDSDEDPREEASSDEEEDYDSEDDSDDDSMEEASSDQDLDEDMNEDDSEDDSTEEASSDQDSDDDMTEEDSMEDKESENASVKLKKANLVKASQENVVKTIDLAASVDWSKGNVELVASGDKYYVMHNSKPVAHLCRETASSEIQDIFNKEDVLARAFSVAISTGMQKNSLSNFGFTPITFEIPVDQVVNHQIQAAADKSQEEATTFIDKKVSAIKHGLSIAAAGSVKNIWDDFKNPLRDQLVASLTKVGVHSPEYLVDSAFATAGEDYLRTILAKAFDLAEKDDTMRNEIARMVDTAKASVGKRSAAEELASRLTSGSLRMVIPTSEETASASKDDYSEKTRKLLNSLRGF